jgi:hypothetical protein
VGLPNSVPDQRFPALLPNGPFQITKYVDYAAPVGDPVHRFFQVWQQIDSRKRDLFVWGAETSGEGSQNRDDPASSTNQGAVAMGFYNMAAGDAPYFRQLADNISDTLYERLEISECPISDVVFFCQIAFDRSSSRVAKGRRKRIFT